MSGLAPPARISRLRCDRLAPPLPQESWPRFARTSYRHFSCLAMAWMRGDAGDEGRKNEGERVSFFVHRFAVDDPHPPPKQTALLFFTSPAPTSCWRQAPSCRESRLPTSRARARAPPATRRFHLLESAREALTGALALPLCVPYGARAETAAWRAGCCVTRPPATGACAPPATKCLRRAPEGTVAECGRYVAPVPAAPGPLYGST